MRRRLRRAALAAAPVLVLAGAAAGAMRLYDRPGPLLADRAVVVPRGGLIPATEALQAAGVLVHPAAFRLAVLATRGQGALHAGEFAFPAHASLRETLSVLRTARPVQHRLTIPEGLTGRQMAALLDRAEALTGSAAAPEEGSVLPQTYAYEYGTPRSAILDRARLAMARALDLAWADRAPGLPLATPREAVILASIVERETARPEERAHVAAVYLNRLRQGLKLQADPTVIYAASNGAGLLDHRLTRAELDRDDPFNTYRSPGLPPGPIAAPGLAAISAVLHPADSEDLYFVADGTGGHAFARTLEDHARNVARWRAQR